MRLTNTFNVNGVTAPISVVSANNNPISERQASGVRQAYVKFCMAVSQSVSPTGFHYRTFKLSDGTIVMFQSNGGVHSCMVYPVAPSADPASNVISYTAFFDIEFFPIFDRPLYKKSPVVNPNGDPPPLPDYPDYNGPTYTPAPYEHRGRYQYLYSAVDNITHLNSDWLVSVSVTSTGGIPNVETTTAYDGWGQAIPRVTNGPFTPLGVSLWVPGMTKEQTGLSDEEWTLRNYEAVDAGLPVIPLTPEQLGISPTNTGPYNAASEARNNAAKAYSLAYANKYVEVCQHNAAENVAAKAYSDAWDATNAAALAVVQAAITAYEAMINQMRADYEAAYAAWEAAQIDFVMPDYGVPSDLKSERRLSRNLQIAAAQNFEDGGIGNFHLTARILSFPYPVGYHTESSLYFAESGEIRSALNPPVGDAESGSVLESTTFTFVGACREAVWYGTGSGPFPLRQYGFYLRDYLASPLSPFGSFFDGTFQEQVKNQQGTSAHVDPSDLHTLVATKMTDPLKTIVKNNSGDTNSVDSDLFLVSGLTVSVGMLEYECYDQFTEQWLWLPHPKMAALDPVILEIRNSGYRDYVGATDGSAAPIPTDPSPRAIRLRREVTQMWNGTVWTAATGKVIPEADRPVLYRATEATPILQLPEAIVVLTNTGEYLAPATEDMQSDVQYRDGGAGTGLYASGVPQTVFGEQTGIAVKALAKTLAVAIP